jgi:hypothetical protein
MKQREVQAMSKTMAIFVAVTVSAVAALPYTVASAAPVGGALAIKNAAPITIEDARWVGGWRGGGWGWRGRGWGWGFGGGLAAGALIGGALAAPYYYGGYYGGPYYGDAYYADPGYAAPGYYAEPYAGGGGGGGVEYCMQRYRSYNPNTGTYTGNDGRPHPCP